MIAAENVSAGYPGRPVLHGITLGAGPGEMLGLLGLNGAGKTTLLLALAGLIAPSSGRVTVQGNDVRSLAPRERAKRIALVPQRLDTPFGPSAFFVALTGRYPHLGGVFGYGANDEAIAADALAEAKAAHLAKRPIAELSGGEQKRVFIARALAQQASVILLDEAASGLDPAVAVDIHDLLRRKCAAGATVVMAIHDLNLAALYCDRLAFLKDGRVLAQGPPAEVFNEDTLSRVYETRFSLVRHPHSDRAQALPVPGGSRAV